MSTAPADRSFRIALRVLIPSALAALAWSGFQTTSAQVEDSKWRPPPLILLDPSSVPSPGDDEAIGEALTSKTDGIRWKAQKWLEEYSPRGSFARKTLFTYRTSSGAWRRVEAERTAARGFYRFAYWVMEGENRIDEGGYSIDACG
jgi:hypothetical protein